MYQHQFTISRSRSVGPKFRMEDINTLESLLRTSRLEYPDNTRDLPK